VVPLSQLGIVRGDAVIPRALTAAWDRALVAMPQWRAARPQLERNFGAHGDAATWLAALAGLPAVAPTDVVIGPTIRIGRAGDCNDATRAVLQRELLTLQPWRKGPFALFGIDVDTEWRSDWKWARVERHVAPLEGRRVLDVGCGNGYYGWRMCAAGARSVIGVDPTIVYAMQYAAIATYLASARPDFDHAVLPIKLEELPDGDAAFDSVFSMGVLYHRRDPLEHLGRLRAHLRDGGEVVVETLVIGDGSTEVLEPGGRYARMRNVWCIPSPARLLRWLNDAGFADARLADVTATTVAEQRATAWMRGESLAHALDARDPTRTVEGYPAPVRAVVVARK
jgi:tRNA (mo5U34)-methyltransferase